MTEVRARRRPRAILWLWVWELLTAVVIATPIHAWARAGWGNHPDGDAVLFRPGGHALLSWLDDGTPALPIVLRASVVLVAVGVIVAPLLTGALVAALVIDDDDRAPGLGRALRASVGAYLPLIGLGFAFAVIEAALLIAGFFAAFAIERALHGSLGDALASYAGVAVFVAFLVVTLLVGVVGDLARVDIARAAAIAEPESARRRMLGGLLAALRTARRATGAAAGAWSWRAALGLALVALGAFASDVSGGRGGFALFILFAVHQLVMLGRAALRASWLAKAVRLVHPAGE